MKIQSYYQEAGVDEAGRGAFAGPLVAAGVSLNATLSDKIRSSGLIIRDSKKMSRLQRERVYDYLLSHDVLHATHFIHVDHINTHGIQDANIKALREIILALAADIYIIDGRYNLGELPTDKQVKSLINADATYLPTMLAGIVAKVTRDNHMLELHKKYPQYDWINNVGYGTKKHREAILLHGICPLHRSKFLTRLKQ